MIIQNAPIGGGGFSFNRNALGGGVLPDRVGKFFPWSEKSTEISGYFRKGKRGSVEMEQNHNLFLLFMYHCIHIICMFCKSHS